MRLSLLVAFGAAFGLLLAPGVAIAGPGLVAGAVEDDVRAATLVEAETRMSALRVAGYQRREDHELLDAGFHEARDRSSVLENVGAAAGAGTACAST